MSMFQIKPARTLHEIYEQDFIPQKETGIHGWREWFVAQWRSHIEFYAEHHWWMMPIAARGKRPVQNRSNYSTVNKMWPALTVKQAEEWASKDFNIAVIGGRQIFWLDIDEPQKVPASFLEVAATQFLTMRTARGLAIPVERSGRGLGTKQLDGIGVDTVRKGNTYQLVPLSVTCTRDSGTSNHRVDFGKSPCVDGGKHDLRVREFLDLSKPVMMQKTLGRLLK